MPTSRSCVVIHLTVSGLKGVGSVPAAEIIRRYRDIVGVLRDGRCGTRTDNT
jgi:hypothetical protein